MASYSLSGVIDAGDGGGIPKWFEKMLLRLCFELKSSQQGVHANASSSAAAVNIKL